MTLGGRVIVTPDSRIAAMMRQLPQTIVVEMVVAGLVIAGLLFSLMRAA